jgi:DNA-binding NarL/FixJ family response regulator
VTRVLVADDHAIVREGLKRILDGQEGIEIAGEATNGHEVLDRIREGGFDILMLDLSMPGRSGIELIKQVKDERPKLRILVLTMHEEDQYAVRAIRAGASGYLTKESAPGQLVSAIRRLAEGRLWISSNVAEQLALDVRPRGDGDDAPHRHLSDREFEVFQLLVDGRSVSDIAAQLHLSVKTVSTHKTRILQKMNAASVADLVRYAIRHRLSAEPPAPA